MTLAEFVLFSFCSVNASVTVELLFKKKYVNKENIVKNSYFSDIIFRRTEFFVLNWPLLPLTAEIDLAQILLPKCHATRCGDAKLLDIFFLVSIRAEERVMLQFQ